MKTNFDKFRELNKAILEDEEIKILLEQKTKLLNSLTPKYLFNKKTNTATVFFSDRETEILNKIDLFIKIRTETIKTNYNLN